MELLLIELINLYPVPDNLSRGNISEINISELSEQAGGYFTFHQRLLFLDVSHKKSPSIWQFCNKINYFKSLKSIIFFPLLRFLIRFFSFESYAH